MTADSGQSDATTGKAHALGIGWTAVDAPTTAPMAVLTIVTFDNQAEAAGEHDISLILIDQEHQPVMLPEIGKPIEIEGKISLETKPGVPDDSPASAPFVVNIGPGLPLEPGHRYTWKVSVDEKTDESWSTSFMTRPFEPVGATS